MLGEQLVALLTLDNQDRADVRSKMVELAKAGSRIAWGAPVMSMLVVTVFFGVMSLLFLVRQQDMAERMFNLLNMLFGTLVLGFGQVCNHWLGSSAGSAAKDALLRGDSPRSYHRRAPSRSGTGDQPNIALFRSGNIDPRLLARLEAIPPGSSRMIPFATGTAAT